MIQNISRRGFAIGSVALLTVLVSISFFMWWRQTSVWQDAVIDEHIRTLQGIFKRIDDDSHIIGFEHAKNYIDFLNVVTFVGSEVGSMNVAYPAKWKGPYLRENPTMQEQLYQIVRTKKGYYIVPGEGVELSNGKVIGKDIIFDEHSDIEAMLQDENALKFKDYVLAAPLPLEKVQLLKPKKELVVEDTGL